MSDDRKLLNRDVIKYFAIFTMLLNHIANVFLEPETVLYEIFLNLGYFTSITMCYFLVEGYGYTRSKKKYACRLLLFAVISQIPYSMAFAEGSDIEFIGLNMLVTLFLCFLIIWAMENIRIRHLQMGMITGIMFLSVCCDWAVLAPVFTVLFARAEESYEKKKDAYIKAMLIFGGFNFLGEIGRIPIGMNIFQSFAGMLGIALSGIVILFFYNGRQMQGGRKFSKWFFYVFYPVHLLVIGMIKNIVVMA